VSLVPGRNKTPGFLTRKMFASTQAPGVITTESQHPAPTMVANEKHHGRQMAVGMEVCQHFPKPAGIQMLPAPLQLWCRRRLCKAPAWPHRSTSHLPCAAETRCNHLQVEIKLSLALTGKLQESRKPQSSLINQRSPSPRLAGAGCVDSLVGD